MSTIRSTLEVLQFSFEKVSVQDTTITHVIIQMGRDHFVQFQSENRVLMIGNVHLELGSRAGNLSELLALACFSC